MLRQISLGTLGLVVGGVLTVIGFIAYFSGNATLNLAGFFYGIPLLLGGLALKASELKPAPFLQETSSEILALRKQHATPTQNQLRQDVTRYRYGQRIHLEEALGKLGLTSISEAYPVLVGIEEQAIAGAYALVLEFKSPQVPLKTWQERQAKIERFFGPGVRAELSQSGPERVRLALVATSEAGSKKSSG